MSVYAYGAKISIPEIEVLWIPMVGQKENFSMYAIDKNREAYFTSKLDEWFRSLGVFKEIDLVEYLKKSESIRLK